MLLIFILLTLFLSGTAQAAVQTDRLSGADRYRTAAAISKNGWPEGSEYAVLARGDDFADALCAGPLAKKHNAPILLTPSGELNRDTQEELKRLKVKYVIITGGEGAVSKDVENAIKSAGIANVERIFGKDRFETSVKIAEKLGAAGEIVLATGLDFPDALSISAIASSSGMPILLTMQDSLPQAVMQYISSNTITSTYIIGGTGVISDGVKAKVPSPKRLGGRDRYETNTLVMQEFESILKFENIYIAVGDGQNGDGFADALSGAALAAKTSSPVILIYRAIPEATKNYIKSKTDVSKLVTLGGEGAVSTALMDNMTSYIGGAAPVQNPPAPAAGGGGAPAGGGTVTPPSVSIQAAIYQSRTLPPSTPLSAVSNGGTVYMGGMAGATQLYGFYVTSDQNCQLVIDKIQNQNVEGLLRSNSLNLTSGQASMLKLDDILDGTSGNDGVSLMTFRNNKLSTVTISGRFMKEGSSIGTFTINVDL